MSLSLLLEMCLHTFVYLGLSLGEMLTGENTCGESEAGIYLAQTGHLSGKTYQAHAQLAKRPLESTEERLEPRLLSARVSL